ncbi:MAG: hypothetical protein L0387_13555 [Acidobacteria bacterium]|nr:hypothetical protein [Acidobacteriota bacterium]
MTDPQEVTGKYRDSGWPRREPGNPTPGPLRGMGVLAAVCGGLFGGRARPEASVVATLSRQAHPGTSKVYQAAA